MKITDFICPDTGEINCKLCTGEVCDYCGVGCWNNNPYRNCQHDVVTRHLPPSNDINFTELPSNAPEWLHGP